MSATISLSPYSPRLPSYDIIPRALCLTYLERERERERERGREEERMARLPNDYVGPRLIAPSTSRSTRCHCAYKACLRKRREPIKRYHILLDELRWKSFTSKNSISDAQLPDIRTFLRLSRLSLLSVRHVQLEIWSKSWLSWRESQYVSWVIINVTISSPIKFDKLYIILLNIIPQFIEQNRILYDVRFFDTNKRTCKYLAIWFMCWHETWKCQNVTERKELYCSINLNKFYL